MQEREKAERREQELNQATDEQMLSGPDEQEVFENQYIKRTGRQALVGPMPFFWNLAENYNVLIGDHRDPDLPKPGLMLGRDMNLDADWREEARLKATESSTPEEDYNALKPDLGPAIVLGSGPSLNHALKHLNEMREKHNAKIFCAPSQMWSLMYNDVIPDYIVAHDPYEVSKKYLSLEAWDRAVTIGGMPTGSLEKPIIITHPAAPKTTFEWPTFRDTGQMFMLRVANESFWKDINTATGITGYEGIEQQTIIAYSDLNSPRLDEDHGLRHQVMMSPSSTLMAAELAGYMGFPKVYFVGYDQCFWCDEMRFFTMFPDGTESTVPAIPFDNDVGGCEFAKWNDGKKSVFAVRVPGSENEDGDSEHTFRESETFFTQTDMVFGKRTTLRYFASLMGTDQHADMVEVVVNKTPGNLELLPRIGLEEFLAGGTRDIDPMETRAKIVHAGVTRGWFDWRQCLPLPMATVKWLYARAAEVAAKNKQRIIMPSDAQIADINVGQMREHFESAGL